MASSPKPSTGASAPARFPRDFDRNVTPRLTELVRWSGNLVACEAYSFGEALGMIWGEAYRLGAGHLPEADQERLRDWLMSELSSSIEAPPPEGALTPEQARKLWESLRHVT